MPDDEKLAFYLRHRAQIEEWTSLRTLAQDALDEALRLAVRERGETHSELPMAIRKDWGLSHIAMPVDDRNEILVGLAWRKADLFGSGVIIVLTYMPGRAGPLREVIKSATETARRSVGLDTAGQNEWLWTGRLKPPVDVTDLAEFGRDCIRWLEEAWGELRQPILDALPIQ